MNEIKTTLSSATGTVAKNTLMLYMRQVLILLVGLYTVRVVLRTLGEIDYGVYNVIAGVVTILSFLSSSLATASQRYFSFALGLGNKKLLKRYFSVTFEVYLMLVLGIVIFLETFGRWYISYRLVIPDGRYEAALYIYHFSVIQFAISLLSTSYMACLIAHEDMKIYAYISIAEVFFKLTIVFILEALPYDKLIMYGFLMLISSVVITYLYVFYCNKKYSECKLKLVWDGELFKELFVYSAWNLFGTVSATAKNQLVNIVLNQHFGAVINAARAIASQVNSAIGSFSSNFSKALDPKIIKDYAANRREEMMGTMYFGSKLTYILMLIFTLPLVLETPLVLNIWLETPPIDAVLFTRLTLIETLITSVSYPLMTVAQATGKIRLYQAVVGSLLILNFPLSYAVVAAGAPAYSVMLVMIFIAVIATIARLIMLKLLIDYSIFDYMCKVIIPLIIVTVIAFVISCVVQLSINNTILRFLVTVIISILSVCLLSYLIALSKYERNMANVFIKSFITSKR